MACRRITEGVLSDCLLYKYYNNEQKVIHLDVLWYVKKITDFLHWTEINLHINHEYFKFHEILLPDLQSQKN